MGLNKPIKRERTERSFKLLQLKLEAILEGLHKRGDKNSARKVAELTQKVMEEDLTIAFCGHFSAGKSSFINEILQEAILPASPIPTSANVVKIRKGEELAHVYFFEGEALEILPPVSFENVKAFCKDGDHVESVSYQYPFKNLPSDLIVLDTPGVDSTDDAHRVSTESALHLADVIFYVMDYNHVQSEVNLKFIKELQDKEKKIYLVVNQIDKHREEEIRFETYNKRIQESFDDWGIEPASIYFTSLKQVDHPFNDLEIVKETIHLLRQDKLEILPKTIEKAVQHILDEHKEWLQHQQEDTLSELLLLKENNHTPFAELTEKLQMKTAELKAMETDIKREKEAFINQTKQILDNANITPFEMRELAGRYLESKQKGFKIGMLFASKKTQEERSRRLTLFQEDVKERVITQVEKFIHEHIFHFLKEHGLYQPAIFQSVQDISVVIDESYIANHVKQGALVTGDTVLHYTKDLASSIKRDYSKQIQIFMEKIFQQMDDENDENMKSLQNEVRELSIVHEAEKTILAINQEIENQFEQLITILYKHEVKETPLNLVKEWLTLYVDKSYNKIHGNELASISPSSRIDTKEMENNKEKQRSEVVDPKAAAVTLKEAASQFVNIQGFQTVVKDLRNRATKLENQTFTVALFGAFSAGKSSFANALFGEKILPVSPNPTTASINKISPVTKDRPHGTVSVQMKTEEQLFQDVKQALTVFDASITSLAEAPNLIRTVIAKNVHLELEASKKPQYHFLKAFMNGWKEMYEHLGSLLSVSFKEFEAYVAQEEKSCFVEWIEVFYDCPFTQEGLTLVDTPGADSINARHTDVAFDYIKNADAILFVTYYQHAFSKADREFLIQLGRVKDAFSLDKMFFLVNAADLANNQEELQLVSDYVEDQLTAYGIRHPRLFPVSSLLALQEKDGLPVKHPFLKTSLIHEFEQAFTEFIQDDLVQMSIHGAQTDLNRAVALLENYLKEAKLGKEEKERRKKQYAKKKAEIYHMISEYTSSSYHTLMQQETKELLYYVKQRTFLRFSDFFKEAYNPAVLREDGRNMKEQLARCLKEFIQDISNNLSQEVRATTVRIESFIKKSLKDLQMEMEENAQSIEKRISFTYLQVEQIQPIKIKLDFPSLSTKVEKQTAGLFRNAKAFFEKNEKHEMILFLEEQLSPLMDQYLNQNEEMLLKHYEGEMEQNFLEVKTYTEHQMEDFFQGLQAALSEEINMAELDLILENVRLISKQGE